MVRFELEDFDPYRSSGCRRVLFLPTVRRTAGGKEMPTSTITSKGQVTIPKRIRDFLKVKAGDQLDFVIADDGRVLVRPGTVGVDELKGLLHRAGRRPVTLAEMEAAIVRGHGKRS
jgi:antitoxin PrlF